MQSAAGFAVFSRMCSDPLKVSPQIVQKVLIFFSLDSELKGSSIYISFTVLSGAISFHFLPIYGRKYRIIQLQNYTDFFHTRE